jgi:hypothetical protein
MINPYNSPWLKPIRIYIKDHKLRSRYDAIKKHASSTISVVEHYGTLTLNKDIYLAKHSTKFRLRSHLDWAWYTPKTFAQAIDSNTVDSYYEVMLNDIHSDPNVWKDTDFEMELKSFYAARVDRASLI